jgi:hypothetical protein
MNRREFIKSMMGTTAAICTGAAAVNMLKPKPSPFKQLTKAEQEYIIAQALQTPEGRAAIAKAMVEPIRDQVEWGKDGLPTCGHDFNTMTKAELKKKYKGMS